MSTQAVKALADALRDEVATTADVAQAKLALHAYCAGVILDEADCSQQWAFEFANLLLTPALKAGEEALRQRGVPLDGHYATALMNSRESLANFARGEVRAMQARVKSRAVAKVEAARGVTRK